MVLRSSQSMRIIKSVAFMIMMAIGSIMNAQEEDLTGVELSYDSDSFADFIRESDEVADRNSTTALRVGIYGKWADLNYLGLPWVRRKVDGFLLDKLLERGGFLQDRKSHNFVFISNGFTPSYISDLDTSFVQAVERGYSLEGDRPFSSFTGFRSSRRLEGRKRFVHSAYSYDLAVTSSFTFGFTGFGLTQGLDNLFKGGRASANLWDRDENKPYPTGQILRAPIPFVMYSLSGEAVLWQPLRKVLVQVRPELNLGYYTDIGVGVDLGKVMNVEKHVDNLAYTDTNNPSLLSVNNESVGLALTGGFSVRAVLYDAHLNGFYSSSRGHFVTLADTRVFQWEGHVGLKIQLLQKVEISYSISRRSRGFRLDVSRNPIWGTIGIKYLIGEEGEGCYDGL